MTLIALDGFAAYANHMLPDLAQQHLDAFVSQEDYTALTLRTGEHEGDYLSMRGCAGCANNTCVVGCRATLIRRALENTLPGLRTRVVGVPLLRQPAATAVIGWPQHNARPLDRALLGVSETMMVAQRVRQRGRGLQVGVGIALGANDAAARVALAQHLRGHNWRALPVPRPLLPAVAQLLARGAVRWGAMFRGPAPLLVGGAVSDALLPESVPARASGEAMDDAFGREDDR